MQVAQLTGDELAVIIDSLDQTREKFRADGPIDGETPNIDSALDKINGCMTPLTKNAVLVFNE